MNNYRDCESRLEFSEHMQRVKDGIHPRLGPQGPRPGADKNGVTAMLSSVAKLPLHKCVGGTTLNVILTTKLLSPPRTERKCLRYGEDVYE